MAGSAGKGATCLNEAGSGGVAQGWRQGRPRAEPGHVCGSAHRAGPGEAGEGRRRDPGPAEGCPGLV